MIFQSESMFSAITGMLGVLVFFIVLYLIVKMGIMIHKATK